MTESDKLWQEEAKAVGGNALVEVIEKVHVDLRRIDAKVDRLNRAFPADDVEGHRAYHEAIIERNRELRNIRKAIQDKLVITLIWIGLVWAGKQIYALIAARLGIHV